MLENVFDCGRVCASVMSDLELVSSVLAVLAMLYLMVFWDSRLVVWLRLWAGKVAEFLGV